MSRSFSNFEINSLSREVKLRRLCFPDCILLYKSWHFLMFILWVNTSSYFYSRAIILLKNYYSHAERDSLDPRAVSYCSLQNVQKVSDLKRHWNCKISGIQYRFPIGWWCRCNFIFDRARFLQSITCMCINGHKNIFWNVLWKTWDSLVHGMLQTCKSSQT